MQSNPTMLANLLVKLTTSGKCTSKTRLGGGPSGPGLRGWTLGAWPGGVPSSAALQESVGLVDARNRLACGPKAHGTQGPSCTPGGIHSREARGETMFPPYSLGMSSQMAPTRCSGTVRGSRTDFLPTFRTFLGEYGSLLSHDCYFI